MPELPPVTMKTLPTWLGAFAAVMVGFAGLNTCARRVENATILAAQKCE